MAKLGAGKGLSDTAWSEWEDVYQRSLALTPTTDRDKFLATRMRDRIGAIAGFLQTRESAVTARFRWAWVGLRSETKGLVLREEQPFLPRRHFMTAPRRKRLA
jgi:hypothetical protein